MHSLRRCKPALAGLFLLLLATVLTVACGRQSATLPSAPDEQSAPAELPAPRALLPEHPRGASFAEADLKAQGSAFSASLPHNRVQANGTDCDFSPAFTPEGGLPGAAYALFPFSVQGYNRDAVLENFWTAAPADGSLYIGLANWDTDRWDWYKTTPSQPLVLFSLGHHLRGDGEVLAALLVLGSQPASLDYIHLGDQLPVVSLSVDPLAAFVPFDSTLDVSASSDPDGSIAQVDWDLDGDGTYELPDGGLTQTLSPAAAGIHKFSVRVTDNSGYSTVRSSQVKAFAEWKHSWGGGGDESLSDAAWDGGDYIYFTGHTESFSGGLLLMKFNLAGELQWARSGISGSGRAIKIDSEGNLVVLADVCPSFDRMAILKFTPDGSLSWGHSLGIDLGYLRTGGLALRGDNYYFCSSSTYGQADPDFREQGFVACVNSSGGLQWCRATDKTEWSTLRDLAAWSPVFGTESLYATGRIGVADQDVLYLRLSRDGAVLESRRWSGPDPATGRAISVSGSTTADIWIGASETSSGLTNALLLQYSGGSGALCRSWSANGHDTIDSLTRTPDGGFLLGGFTDSFMDGASTTYNGLLVRADASFNMKGFGERIGSSGESVHFNHGAQLVAGVAVLGSGDCPDAASSNWDLSFGVVGTRSGNWSDAPLPASFTPSYEQVSGTMAAVNGQLDAPPDGQGAQRALALLHELQ